MIGHVDDQGRALVSISLRASASSSDQALDVWIDTGFTGDLVLPQQQITRLDLSLSGTVKAVLADGSEVTLMTYTCFIDWYDDFRQLEVIANDGDFPLLGVGMLLERDLCISYRSGEITIE